MEASPSGEAKVHINPETKKPSDHNYFFPKKNDDGKILLGCPVGS